MSRRGCVVGLLLLMTAATVPGPADAQQQLVLAGRRPRFVAAWAPDQVELDMSNAVVLRRRIPLDLANVSVAAALDEISRRAGLQISYSAALLPTERRVTIRAEEIGVAAALTDVLFETGLDVAVGRNGRLAVIESRELGPRVAQTGMITGRLTDAKTQAALAGATVAVEGTRHNATSGNDGRYRILDVAPGTYTVRARYIGYAPASTAVTVSEGQEATADFGLERSAQRLNEVVTTGTVVPTEIKALPTPVTVITDSEITLQRPRTITELLRQVVPTAVSWDYTAYPYETDISVRGASSLTSGGQIKLFVDGVEAASTGFHPVNPSSIGRIEVIRGPEAAAIYGSDAAGGVVQIFTKRADPSQTRPALDLEASAGVVQTPYSGYGAVLRQNYSATLSGGSGDASYTLGGGYTHTGDWIPDQAATSQSSPNVYGAMHYGHGMIDVDVFGRHEQYNVPQVYNPLLAATGFATVTKPEYQQVPFWSQTIGAHISVTPVRWWQNTLTIGFDRFSYDRHQTQPVLSSPGDTLLQVDDEEGIKNSIRYNSSIHGSFGGVSASLMVGVDHYSFRDNEFYTSGATSITGTIQTDPSQPVTGIRNITNNTGYFAQAQVGYRDALFLTGGIRAEENTNFGDSLGTPVSPRIGLSYVRPVGDVTLKIRGSWGRAIRAPRPQLASGFGTDNLPNPRLGPERQRGFDTGVDLVFGAYGSFSATYFNQTADNLIQLVPVGFVGALQVSQYQNVGTVKNTGVELEGAVSAGIFDLKAQYGYARARVEDLGANYTGDLLPGDQTRSTPYHTAGASVSVTPFAGTTLAGGITYVGSWENYDYYALFSCFGGTGPCQPSFRGYVMTYPSFVKMNATLSQQLTKYVSGFVSVDNLTNNQAFEALNFSPVMGRITTVGVKCHF
jgi:outer membrane receptor protein involved in Fe transport